VGKSSTLYRVIGESVADGTKTYVFQRVEGGPTFTRSCSPEIIAFHMGSLYTREDIDLICPPGERPIASAARDGPGVPAFRDN
jgi:hypothetical protein